MRFIPSFFIIGTLFVSIVFPQSVHAQVNQRDEAYRAYLIEIIELLQQQIIQLTAAQRGSVHTQALPFTSFLLDDETDVVERYVLKNGAFTIQNSTHREFINRFLALTPDKFDLHVKEAVIFEGTHNFDAFVETVAPYQEDTWRFALHSDMFEFQPDSDGITELLVHEFAHIGSYASIPNVVEPTITRCHDYFKEIGCPPAASYLNAFTGEFWSKRMLNLLTTKGTLTSEYSKRSLAESFVSDYAATSPAEDFAESFAAYVLHDIPRGESERDRKVSFFSQYPELRLWREEIRTNR